MKICYLGPYSYDYPRNRVILKGLEKNQVKIVECNSNLSNRIFDYANVLATFRKHKFDLIMLGARGIYYGQPLVPLVRKFTNKPIVFDAMLTLYETRVIDRKVVKPNTLKAHFFYTLDYKAMHYANLVLSDTVTHSNFYSKFYDYLPENFHRVLVSSDDDYFYPRIVEKEKECFKVVFWGGFNPLQGIKHIVQSAKLIENHHDIFFEIRGFGQTYPEIYRLHKKLKIKNVRFNPSYLPYNELPNYIAQADVCLGIFGDTKKAKRVIPNKAVEALAMGKPLITGDSPASREILTHKKNCLLIPMANSKELAAAIVLLKESKKLRSRLAKNGHDLFREKLSPKVIGADLKKRLTEIISNN